MDSILEAVFTVSPKRQYRGMVRPTTPATQGPENQTVQGEPRGQTEVPGSTSYATTPPSGCPELKVMLVSGVSSNSECDRLGARAQPCGRQGNSSQCWDEGGDLEKWQLPCLKGKMSGLEMRFKGLGNCS